MTCRPVTRRPVNATKRWRFGAKSPEGNIFRILDLLQFNRGHRLTFYPNFMPMCPVTKKCKYPLQNCDSHLFAAILRLFVQGAKSLTREIWVWPTYACKILSGSVKVCRSYSRKANFEQIHIKLSCVCITAYNNNKGFTVGVSVSWFSICFQYDVANWPVTKSWENLSYFQFCKKISNT